MAQTAKLWVLDDDASIRWVLERTFAETEFQVRCFEQAGDLYQALETEQPDLLSDIRMPERWAGGIAFCKNSHLSCLSSL